MDDYSFHQYGIRKVYNLLKRTHMEYRLGLVQKENKVPTKQGALYELRLGKERGAYLPKDIMYDNPKSISLLAGSQIVKSFSSLNASMAISDNKQKQYTQTLSNVDSIAATMRLLHDDIIATETQSNKLKIEQMRLRHQFAIFNDSINEANSHLLQQYAPLLRGLYKAVKQQASQQKEEMFKMDREVRELSEAKRHLIEGIFQCEEKIAKIQKAFDSCPLKRENYD